MTRSNGEEFLDPDRFDDLAGYMLEVGVRYAARYESGPRDRDPDVPLPADADPVRRLDTHDARRQPQPVDAVPAGGFVPLHERDGPCWEDGYDEVDERLSAVQPMDGGLASPVKPDALRAICQSSGGVT